MIHLSEDLLIGFAKSMKTENAPHDVTLFGTVSAVNDDGTAIVILDGSEAETKANCAVLVKSNDRVMVLMKDHKAVISGNLSNNESDPSTLPSGYHIFSNGMKICWGRITGCSVSANGSTTYTVDLPVTYTAGNTYECFVGLYGAMRGYCQASLRNEDSFNCVLLGAGTDLSDRAINWFCIGY